MKTEPHFTPMSIGARSGSSPVRGAQAYLSKLPPAIAGQAGHAATYHAACRLVEFGLGQEEAWSILAEWNLTHCEPPWTEAELRHKLADAFRRTQPRSCFTRQDRLRAVVPFASHPRQVRRPILPELGRGTPQQIAKLSSVRAISMDGLSLASERGLLGFADFKQRPAWFVLDASGRVAQARRLDGKPWAEGVKARTLCHSDAKWPVGTSQSAPFPNVLFCEGGPDLLSACAFIRSEGREDDCCAVAMLGGGISISPEACAKFAGKRVRIVPHLDETGEGSVVRWSQELERAGAMVDAFSLKVLRCADGRRVKDLNDLAVIHADDFEEHRSLWSLCP